MQSTLDVLGGSADSAARASPVTWAQLAGAAQAGCSNPSIPLTIVHTQNWDELADKLPGMFQVLTACLDCMS